MTKRRSLMAATLCCASLLLLGGCGGGSSADVFNFLEKAGQHDAAAGTDYERGKRQLAAGEYGLAAESFAAEVARNPNSVRALNGEAIAYAKLGKAEVAKQLFETALAVDRDSPETLNNLAYLHLKQGDPQGALVLAERAKSALTTGTNDKSPPVLSQVLANNEALMRVPLSAQETQQNTVNTAAVQIDKDDTDNAVQPKPAAPVAPVQQAPLLAAAAPQETVAAAPQSQEPATVAVTPQPVVAKTAPRNLIAAAPQATAAANPAPQEIAAAVPAPEPTVAATVPQEAPTPSPKPQDAAVVTEQPPADSATSGPQGPPGVQRPWVTVASDAVPAQTTTSATVPDQPATASALTAGTAPNRTSPAATGEPEPPSATPAPRETASSAAPPEPAVPAVPPRRPTATGAPPPDQAATMLQAAARASGAKLRIANGSGRHWMAHRFKQYFASRGLNVGTLLNASSFGRPSSVLYYDSDVRVAAQSVAELLPASVRLVEIRGPTGKMDLVMGKNLDPFDIQLAAGRVEPDKLAQR